MNGKKVFWDTNLFIYLIEESDQYKYKITNMLKFLEENDYEIVTSTLTLGEILTKPYKENRLDLVEKYRNFFHKIEMIELNSDIATLFSKVRADYGIKTPDAIQLASAVYSGCKLFATNDDQLKRFKECDILLLNEF